LVEVRRRPPDASTADLRLPCTGRVSPGVRLTWPGRHLPWDANTGRRRARSWSSSTGRRRVETRHRRAMERRVRQVSGQATADSLPRLTPHVRARRESHPRSRTAARATSGDVSCPSTATRGARVWQASYVRSRTDLNSAAISRQHVIVRSCSIGAGVQQHWSAAQRGPISESARARARNSWPAWLGNGQRPRRLREPARTCFRSQTLKNVFETEPMVAVTPLVMSVNVMFE
jgi:hypothetical protein